MSSENSSSTWADRRGLFQRGKEVHEPGQKVSGAGIADAVRRASIGSSSGEGLTKTTSQTSTGSSDSPTSQRRRSSGVRFENLTNLKRGSEDYGDRRASHNEMQGQSGFVSGWFNKTFRGIQASTAGSNAQQQQQQSQQQQQEPRRGVME